MVVFPCTFALGYGATVPSSFALLVESIDSPDPSVFITAGQPMLGVAMALRALTHNNFCTFLGKDNKCGPPVGKFSNKFKATPGLLPSMLIEEGFCPRNSNSSLQHIRNYDRLLMAALMHTKTVYPDKYGAILKEHTKEQQPEPPTKTRPRQHSDSDSSLPLQKRVKATETKTSFAETFYRFLLGQHTLTSPNSSVTW